MFPQAKIDGTESNWVPVVLRELRNTDAQYGKNTLEARFNLYGALQHSGLDVGQFVGLRGECDGETLQGCKYSLSSKTLSINMIFYEPPVSHWHYRNNLNHHQ